MMRTLRFFCCMYIFFLVISLSAIHVRLSAHILIHYLYVVQLKHYGEHFFEKKNCFLWILALTNIIIQETSFLFWYLETMSPHFSKYHKNGYEKFSKYLTAFIQYINMPLHSISILKATHTYRNKTYKVYLLFCWWVIDVTVLYIVKKNL